MVTTILLTKLRMIFALYKNLDRSFFRYVTISQLYAVVADYINAFVE